ncbi:MAG: DUF3034 family protein [Oxalobacteraceae bacterium]|nr:MAG: DUF3034 family protein [Oxalobacteraceae bacterium]
MLHLRIKKQRFLQGSPSGLLALPTRNNLSRQMIPASLRTLLAASVLALSCGAALAAGPASPDLGKLLATGGVSQVEGAGGGGLTPWALITGYGSRDSYGGNVHATAIRTQDHALYTYGFAMGLADRVEVSLARQSFRGDGGALDGLRIGQDIAGIKLKLAGDAVLEQDSLLPQIAVGVMAKRNTGVSGLGAVGNVKQLGAASDHGVDVYLSATKILLDRSLLLNGTLRATQAAVTDRCLDGNQAMKAS